MTENESAPADTENRLEAEKEELFGRYQPVLEDSIFQKITNTIEASWENLNDDDRQKILKAYRDLLEAITNYADSYRTLKGVSRFRPSATAGIESVKRYQGEVSDADRRERELHESFLDSVNILSRRMKELGLDNS